MSTPLGTDFDPNGFPLEPGVRLLEASAGTGKTFALAHLVLRLVTEKAIPLRRLLVVTFTDAASSELRERIGRRLQQALTSLQDPGREPPDAVLEAWLSQQGRAKATGTTGEMEMRLLLALEDLDGADITTIHGFCQRSLQRHALEARRPPGLTIDREGDTLVEQVVHAYWQEQVLRLPLPLLRGLDGKGLKPETLQSLLHTLDGDPGLELDPLPLELTVDSSLATALPPLCKERWELFTELWPKRGADLLEALFAQAREWKAADLPHKPYTLKATAKWNPAVVEAFLASHGDPGGTVPYDQIVKQEVLTSFLHPGTFCKSIRLAEGEARPIQLPERALMEAVADLVDGPAELALLHACHWGRRELSRRRERQGLCSYGDLLSSLDPGVQATGPTPLLEAVGGRYSAALIDEFQDTDPIQWRILRLTFCGGQHLLVMVGDPKQAIYRFRGGDLATYLAARSAAQECYQMRENRRSTPELIGALNQLFSRGLPRSGLQMPLLQARAARGGDGLVPIELIWLAQAPTLPSRSEVESRLPEQVAAYVASSLANPPKLLESTGVRPLEPDDICVLVSTHTQAEQQRQALQELGIATRLVSHADVFATPAARALQRLLDALTDPADASRLRLLAASPLMGWSAETITGASPLRWSELATHLQDMARDWPEQGLLGPLATVLGAAQMASLSRAGRFLADLQQVAELVQQRLHQGQLSPHATARWLRRRRHQEHDSVPEAEQTQSDRVRQAVAVVTVHRSKGLEYPLVICPYLWQEAGKGGKSAGRRWHPDPLGAPRLDLHRNRQWGVGYAADRDHWLAQVAERERLAYVAMTRAMHRLVLAWGPVKGQESNPLYPWLLAEDPLPDPEEGWPRLSETAQEWRQRLGEAISRRHLSLRVVDPPSSEGRGWRSSPKPTELPSLGLGPIPKRPLSRGWARSSYTSWTQERRSPDQTATSPAPAQLEEGRDTQDPDLPVVVEAMGDADNMEPAIWPERGLWADLPGGAGFGECLHRVLEQIDYGTVMPTAEVQSLVSHELRRAGLAEALAAPLLAAIEQMLQTPFGGVLNGVRPADLPHQERLNELHFDLSLSHVRAADLAKAFANHPGGAFSGSYSETLARLPVNHCGFLTGSIDLVFPTAWNGTEQWWVLDWKSNWLGQRDPQGRNVRCGPADYGPEALVTLMASHHYPLQAHLYLVALHRYLAWRLPSYNPAVHLGGYVYVFVRGTPGEAGQARLPGPVPGMLVERPPVERVLALDRALGHGPPNWTPGTHP